MANLSKQLKERLHNVVHRVKAWGKSTSRSTGKGTGREVTGAMAAEARGIGMEMARGGPKPPGMPNGPPPKHA